MKTFSPADFYVAPDAAFDRRFAYIAYGLLALCILFFTYLHFFEPQVLRVPDNKNVASWTNPTFEQTLIYDRMTPAERDKVRSEGIPNTGWFPVLFDLMGDFTALFYATLCFLHARKHFGFWMASCFLIGSFVFTGLQESIAILLGRFTAGQAYTAGQFVSHGSYFFCKSSLWFIETPVAVCLSWFWIAYTCVFTAGKLFPKMNVLGRATVGGLIAMIIDLWLDPVATSPEFMMWLWASGDMIKILGINSGNFAGWFLLIFAFAILWEFLPSIVKRLGRFKASIAFFCIVLIGNIVLLMILMFYNIQIVSGIMRLVGTRIIEIPPGW